MSQPDIEVRVWDSPTRLFHWLLAICVAVSLVTGFFDGIFGVNTITWHSRAGYCALGLVVFRVIWGFIGGTYARFSSFLRGPTAALRYLGSLLGGGRETSLGHNPLGGWSAIALISTVGVQAATGLFLSDEDYGFEAPLSKYVSRKVGHWLNEIHEGGAEVLLVLVGLHLAAIAFYAIVKKTNLVPAMVTGFKRVSAVKPEDPSRGGNIFLGLIVAVAVGYGVWWLVTQL